tara:strand:+ start:5916 stop:7613 length:1698 start_codon:yes stop_codon:yes gene_type:complete
MKFITLHSDFIKFKALKKALKSLDLTSENTNEQEVKESLVVLTAVEKGDNKNTIKNLVKEVKKISQQVKASTIVLYPYAHLSSNLGSPKEAQNILHEAEKELKKSFKKVIRAPFGYYKSFEIKVKGHPLSELSREIKSEKQSQEKTDYDPKDFLHETKTSKLDTSKLKDNDHRILGQKMELFTFNESSPGMAYWLPNGTIIYNELIKFWREEHAKLGYQETITPIINKSSLYKVSGHWSHYKDNMFISKTDEGDYGVKAMNCPNAMVIFKSKSRSYRDLPLRLSDTDRLHRYELSGTLNGLLRVRSFQQDDSHNFVTENMIKKEYEQIFDICKKFYSIFGMKYSFRLGTKPKKAIGDKKVWDKAEKALKEVLKKSGVKFKIEEGDGAFYGPKVDILMKDSMNREWQMGTIQLDMQMPERFGLKYTDEKGKEKTPIVIHRVIYGSLERFIGILLEHTNGNLPTWLSPTQVRIINFTDRNNKYVDKILNQIKQEIPNIRIDTDLDSVPLAGKIRDAELMKIPYIIVLGDKEEQSNNLAIRNRGSKKIEQSPIEIFIKNIKEEIEQRK